MNADQTLRDNIKRLRDQILNLRLRRAPTLDQFNEAKATVQEGVNGNFLTTNPLRVKKTIQCSNDGAVKSLDFGANLACTTLAAGASAAGGSIVIWDVYRPEKRHWIPLPSPWVCKARTDPYSGQSTGAGGLENSFYLYRIGTDCDLVIRTFTVELKGHDAVVYDASYMDRDRLMTCSGDRKLKLWDIDRNFNAKTLEGHMGDVVCLDVEKNSKTIVSGATDFTARLWDTRNTGDLIYTFDTQSRDVNGVTFFPDGFCFGTALSNSQVHLYDQRANCKMLSFRDDNTYGKFGTEELKFSSSGRLMFVRYSDNKVYAYDITGTGTDGVIEIEGEGTVINGALCEVSAGSDFQTSCMAIDPEARCLALGVDRRHNTDTIVKMYWPHR